MNRLTRTPFGLFASSALVFAIVAAQGGCDKKSTDSAPPAASRDNPQSALGKSAKMARDTRDLVGTQQAQIGQMADGLGSKENEAQAAAAAGPGTKFAVSGVNFVAPGDWAKGPGSQFRAAEFTAPGNVAIIFSNAGGGVEPNIERWRGMVTGDGGDNKFKQTKEKIGSLVVHTVSMEGTYAGMSRTGAAAPEEPGSRFIGIIIEGADGPIQLRITGPIDAVRAVEPRVKAMLDGMKPGR